MKRFVFWIFMIQKSWSNTGSYCEVVLIRQVREVFITMQVGLISGLVF